jgi:hypothetical protein
MTVAADAGCKPLKATLSQFDGALDHTRADRARALAQDALPHLAERLGSVPSSSAGRAVWCHYALGIGAVLDRSDGSGALPPGHNAVMAGARQHVVIADRLLQASSGPNDPAGWAEIAGHAAALCNEALRIMRARTTIECLVPPALRVQPSRGMGDGAQQGPELSL